MYNRYVPQSDGTYRRNRMPDSPPRQSPISSEPEPPKQAPCPPAPTESCPCPLQRSAPCCPEPRQLPQRRPKSAAKKQDYENSIGGFLKHLLPKNFDTADLIVVLLLLLMSGDCAEDQNTALLTLVLYLFL